MVLDHVSIFKKNGVVLYTKSLAAIKGSFVGGSIINHLIRTVLLEEKAGAAQVKKKGRKMVPIATLLISYLSSHVSSPGKSRTSCLEMEHGK